MIRSRVEETTTTTGVTDITLAGATSNNQTLNTAFGTNRLFKYYIDGGSQWEAGTGYLSAPTTLVRQIIEFNSSGTTTAINFSAGTKRVFCDMSASSHTPPIALRASGEWVRSEHIGSGQIEATLTMTANYTYANPFWYSPPNQLNGISFYVNNVVSGAVGRVGVYCHSTTKNQPGKLLLQSGELDVSSTGWKTFDFSSPISIQGEQVWVALMVSGAVQVVAIPYTAHGLSYGPVNRSGGFSYMVTNIIDDRGSSWTIANGGSGMIDFPSTPDVTQTSTAAPYIIMRTA